jgi:hypothetical protein
MAMPAALSQRHSTCQESPPLAGRQSAKILGEKTADDPPIRFPFPDPIHMPKLLECGCQEQLKSAGAAAFDGIIPGPVLQSMA